MSYTYFGVLLTASTPTQRVEVGRAFVDACQRHGVTNAIVIDFVLREMIDEHIESTEYDRGNPVAFILRVDSTSGIMSLTSWNRSMPCACAAFDQRMLEWYGAADCIRWCLWREYDVDDLFEYIDAEAGTYRSMNSISTEPPINKFYGIHPVKSKRKIAVAPLP